MKYYGSLNNRFEENKMFCDEIKVGSGVTEYKWSDREAYEVVAVNSQKDVVIRKYDHKHVGEAFTNKWQLVSNENNPTVNLVRRGKYWYAKDVIRFEDVNLDDWQHRLYLASMDVDVDTLKAKGKVTRYIRMNVSFGVADYYYDYEF